MLQHQPWCTIPGLRHGFLPGRVQPAVPVLFPRQVHGTRVVIADPSAQSPEADGLVTAEPGVVGVVTADCVPMLLVAAASRVAAAVHVGWRGAAAGIVGEAIIALRATFGVEPDAVEACLGPAIGACCYEVGPEVRAAFVERSGSITDTAWGRRGSRDVLDLREAVRALLAASGVEVVARLGPCTRCTPNYCSYRRDGLAVGRQASFIGWA